MTREPRRWHPPDQIRVRHHRESPLREVHLLTEKQKMRLAIAGIIVCVGGIAFFSLAWILGW